MSEKEVVLKVDNLSKLYRLGEIGTGTLSHDLNRWVARLRGKDDPFAKIGQVNDRSIKSENPYVYALKEISFSVNKGEVIGIIGKNGAGKSTLLKIIAQITSPTTGSIKAKGRIASLLEVGTGMHPEMTARENVFLNGAILGMTKKEIHSKFDEIMDFAGCSLYIDTPIKRFSSGMKVRLAFAVAAFLEPEILIVDEVLAVGDAEFQNKAIGKMKEVTNDNGRTVLFVSHNMTSVMALCSKTIFLEHGMVKDFGDTKEIISKYLQSRMDINLSKKWEIEKRPKNSKVSIVEVTVKPISQEDDVVYVHSDFEINLSYLVTESNLNVDITYRVYSDEDVLLFVTGSISDENWHGKKFDQGAYSSRVVFPGHFLNSGNYRIDVVFGHSTREVVFKFEDLISFSIEDSHVGRGTNYNKAPGILRPFLKWETNLING